MRSFLIFLSYIIIISHSIGQSTDAKSTANDLIINSIQNNECVGIAAGVSVNGQILWQKAEGFRDEKNKLAYTSGTLTRIASITKPMTAVAILQLYERGKLDLDAPVQTCLPDFPLYDGVAITTRQLLSHSSGIDDYKSEKERENTKNYPDMSAAVDIFKNRKLVSAPGTEFYYTTYGYTVLGLIIEKVSGMSYEDYIKENIWKPAGMTNTNVEVANKMYENKSLLYHKNSKGKIKEAKPTDLSDRIPGGGVQSTLADLLKFGDAVVNLKLLNESTTQLMWSNTELKKEGNPYGFGWFIYGERPNIGHIYGHTGGQTGSSAFLMVIPEQKTSVAVISNTSGALQEVSNIIVNLIGLSKEMSEEVIEK